MPWCGGDEQEEESEDDGRPRDGATRSFDRCKKYARLRMLKR